MQERDPDHRALRPYEEIDERRLVVWTSPSRWPCASADRDLAPRAGRP